MDHCSTVLLPSLEISILLLVVEFQSASRSATRSCSSALPAAAAAASCQMSWHHAAWRCELHLPVSTCGMTDVLFHTLLRMFLAHTPTNVIVSAAQVRSLPFTCSLFISFSFLSVVGSTHWKAAVTYVFTYHLHYNLDNSLLEPLNLYMALPLCCRVCWQAQHFSLRSGCQSVSTNHDEGLW